MDAVALHAGPGWVALASEYDGPGEIVTEENNSTSSDVGHGNGREGCG